MEKQKNFYLYYLRRPDYKDKLQPTFWEPFYVGIGTNYRMKAHRREAKNLLDLSSNNYTNTNYIRNNIIHELWSYDLDFKEEKIYKNLPIDLAIKYEIEKIKIYGRINNGTGCLANLTNGGEYNTKFIVTDKMLEDQQEKLQIEADYFFRQNGYLTSINIEKDTILRRGKRNLRNKNEEINVVDDQWMNVGYTVDLSDVIYDILLMIIIVVKIETKS